MYLLNRDSRWDEFYREHKIEQTYRYQALVDSFTEQLDREELLAVLAARKDLVSDPATTLQIVIWAARAPEQRYLYSIRKGAYTSLSELIRSSAGYRSKPNITRWIRATPLQFVAVAFDGAQIDLQPIPERSPTLKQKVLLKELRLQLTAIQQAQLDKLCGTRRTKYSVGQAIDWALTQVMPERTATWQPAAPHKKQTALRNSEPKPIQYSYTETPASDEEERWAKY